MDLHWNDESIMTNDESWTFPSTIIDCIDLQAQLLDIHGMCKDITWALKKPRIDLKLYLVCYGRLDHMQCFRFDIKCLHPIDWHMIIVYKNQLYACVTNMTTMGMCLYQMNIVNPFNLQQAFAHGLLAATMFTSYRSLKLQVGMPLEILSFTGILYNDRMQDEMADYFLVRTEAHPHVVQWYMEMYPKQDFLRLEPHEILKVFEGDEGEGDEGEGDEGEEEEDEGGNNAMFD